MAQASNAATNEGSGQELDIMNDPALHRMEQNLLLVLTHYQLPNNVISNFAASGIRFCDLAGLVKEDLQMLGINDDAVKEQLLSEFRCLQGQEPSLRSTYECFREDPEMSLNNQLTAIDLIQSQLHSMNMLLAATMIKVGVMRSEQASGAAINNLQPPGLVIQVLHKISSQTNQMMNLIKELQTKKAMEEQAKKLKRKKYRDFGLALLIVTSGLVVGAMMAKHWRGVR